MSHFHCEHCGALIADSPRGYVTGCEHYPLRKETLKRTIKREYLEALVELYGKKEDGND